MTCPRCTGARYGVDELLNAIGRNRAALSLHLPEVYRDLSPTARRVARQVPATPLRESYREGG